MNRKWSYSAVLILGLFSSAAADAQITQGSDRQRIRVAEIPDSFGGPSLKVLRTDAGTPLRAGESWIWNEKPRGEPREFYAAMRAKGMNAVRLICFDVWIHDRGWDKDHKLDWSNPTYRKEMLSGLSDAVDHCAANGMYAIINYHGSVEKYDEAYATEFWEAVSPVFKNRSHVIFETQNEPIAGPGKNGGADSLETLLKLRRIHDLVRRNAPDSHIMVLTPCGISAWGSLDGMKQLVDRFSNLSGLPIDWSKTSVAYHLYHADTELFPKAENVRNLHSNYPAWPSEINFPKRFSSREIGAQDGDTERSVSFGDHEFTMETCERLGLGWAQWQIRSNQLEKNWPLIWADAIDKGYPWAFDPEP